LIDYVFKISGFVSESCKDRFVWNEAIVYNSLNSVDSIEGNECWNEDGNGNLNGNGNEKGNEKE